MARVAIFVTLFVVLAICTMGTESLGRKKGLLARGYRRTAQAKKSGNIVENQMVKQIKTGKRTGIFDFFSNFINKVLEAVGIKKKTEKPDPEPEEPEVTTAAAAATTAEESNSNNTMTTAASAEDGTTGTEATEEPETTGTSGTSTTTVP